jgi:hypothetical protein
LLRNPKCFDNDATIQPYIQSGKARLVAGDALVQDQVANAWIKAGEGERPGQVDVFLFTVGAFLVSWPLRAKDRTTELPSGGYPDFTLKGIKLSPPDLCTRSMLTALRAMPAALRAAEAQPRIIALSSAGITHASHKELPLAWRIIYPRLFASPHEDKYALEQVLHHVGGWTWDSKADGTPADTIAEAEAGWREQEGVPAQGTLREILVVRPAFLTDGPCKGAYRTTGSGYYTISRQDVAHFIVEKVLGDWSTYRNRAVTVGY